MADEALQEVQLPSDAELFNASVTDTPEPETPKQPRNVDGTFAAKTEAEPPAEATKVETPKIETPAAPPQRTAEDSSQIPAWRLREEAEARREATRQLEAERQERQRERAEFMALQQRIASLEKPPVAEPEPDPLLDPDGYAKRISASFEERLRNQERNFDMRLAHSRHGKVFEDAYAAAQQALASGDMQLRAMMNATSSPGETLVNWHKQQQTIKEVGADPKAWLEKKLDEALSDPTFLAKAVEKARGAAAQPQPNGRPAVQLPPSLSNLTRGGDTLTTTEHSDPMSDAALFAHATRR